MNAAEMSADVSSILCDVRAVALMLSCSVRHVHRLCDAGRLPSPVRLGSLIRWDRRVIEAWIAGGCKPVRQAAGKGGQHA
jgi:predicted DNA-binding transcriptional regulator AlpA